MHTVGVADPYFASTADEMARTCDRYISSFGELGRCQDKFAVLTKNIKVRRGEPEGEYHTEKVL